ncbi:MAG: transposase, partial [Sedimenticola sp.]
MTRMRLARRLDKAQRGETLIVMLGGGDKSSQSADIAKAAALAGQRKGAGLDLKLSSWWVVKYISSSGEASNLDLTLYLYNGHIKKAHYNSCKHRNCPACNALPSARWLEKQQAMVLDCGHYHAVFTLPHYLLALWSYNNRLMGDLLFRCAIDTLRKLLDDPKYLGATVGIIAALHSWGRDQRKHPHLHLLITGGGLNSEGTWKNVSGDFLLPFRVVRKIFRAKYVEALKQAYQAGKLQLPPGLQEKDFDALMKKVATRVKWRTHFCAPYSHGKGVVSYLARYVKGGPFKNQQILADTEERVTFSYMDYTEHRKKPC